MSRLSGLMLILSVGACLVTVANADDAPGFPNLHKQDGFPDWTTSVAFSPDGALLAAGSYDVVRLWDVDNQKAVADLKTRCGFAHELLFSPDGQTLYVGGYQQIQVWNIADKKKQATWRGHRGYVRDMVFSPDGTQVATASEDATVRIWQTNAGDADAIVLETGEFPVLGVAWSPDGQLLATAAGDEARLTKPGLVKLWNASDRTLVRELPPHKMVATDVAFSPDGKTLLVTGFDEQVTFYEVASGLVTRTYEGFSRPTNSVLISPGGDVAIVASGGRFKGKNEVQIIGLANGDTRAAVEVHEGQVTGIAYDSGHRRLATASYDQTVAVWDLSSLILAAEVEATPLPAEEVTEVAPASVPATPIESEQATETECVDNPTAETPQERPMLRVGIIGLDTSHATAFTKALNAEQPAEALVGLRVVAAYPKGSPDIESSTSRVPGYTTEVQAMGVAIVDSLPALLEQVDVVLLETNDGRPHLEQVLPVLKAGKPVFVDKPIAGSLEDAIAIVEAARHYQVPLFSASSLRWLGEAQTVRGGAHGAVLGCDTYSPCSLEATHPDLYWYGIHGVEALFTVMGTGCESVTRTSTADFDQVTGVWDGGRIGTFRGLRTGARGYGGTAFTEKKTVVLGPYPGYGPLLESIAHFFRTGEAPVSAEETIEIYAFMSAADLSKQQGGVPVDVSEVIDAARQQATSKLRDLIPDYTPAN
ncbi:MAG: Gfo/Idh/MocA family oxidoreductase [Planctomycetaceae bacterium]